MARLLRISYRGAIYHVSVRGNARQDIFLDNHDRKRFLERLAASVETYGVRIYLFCLMPNHFHLLVETPDANLSEFMGSLLTGYAVYFNRRHQRVGHVTQGRYSAKLVRGDDYLHRLSRYVHLNPIFTESTRSLTLMERIRILREYPWSTYQGYTVRNKRLEMVDYEPLLTLVTSGRRGREKAYRRYVESSLVQVDEEFLAALKKSACSIGNEEFQSYVKDVYSEIAQQARRKEDVALRRGVSRLEPEAVLDAVAEGMNVSREDMMRRRRNALDRAMAVWMLCRYAGCTQREAAEVLNMGTGASASLQIHSLRRALKESSRIRNQFGKIDARLGRQAQTCR